LPLKKGVDSHSETFAQKNMFLENIMGLLLAALRLSVLKTFTG
jgi:hypothetical protein